MKRLYLYGGIGLLVGLALFGAGETYYEGESGLNKRRVTCYGLFVPLIPDDAWGMPFMFVLARQTETFPSRLETDLRDYFGDIDTTLRPQSSRFTAFLRWYSIKCEWLQPGNNVVAKMYEADEGYRARLRQLVQSGVITKTTLTKMLTGELAINDVQGEPSLIPHVSFPSPPSPPTPSPK